MKTKYVSIRLIVLIVWALGLYACNKSDDSEPSPEETITAITLDQTTLKMNVGDLEQLRVSGANGKQISWSSSDPTVATVIDGMVTTLKGGKTTIMAKLGGATASCSVDVSPDIFMAGIVYDAEGGFEGYYWKNNTAFLLPNAGQINGVYADGNNVYVVGSSFLDRSLDASAMVWKNGQTTPLTDGSKSANARAVYVADGDVYVVGSESTNSQSTAMLWKNGLATALPDNNGNAEANAITVVDGDVYIAGTYKDSSGNPRAAYWKNGILSLLGNDTRSFANDIFVDRGDIYISGLEENKITYWKNGSPVYIVKNTPGFRNTSVFLFENDLFITGTRAFGSSTDDIGFLWKNGIDVSATFMPTIDRRLAANKVIVWNKDVHVVGFVYESRNFVGHYWKNGQVQSIEESLGAVLKDLFIR